MVVKVTKPQVNVREKISELDKPSGIAGEAMLRAETPQEQFNLINAGRKNLIINGAMQVAQRGTSFTSYSGYCLDRYKAFGHNYERIDNGDFYSLRATYVSGTTAQIYHPVELQRGMLENGQTYTLSFKYKKSGDPLNIEVFYRIGTTGSNVVQQPGAPFDLPTSDDFTHHSFTFTCKGRISAHTALNIRFGQSSGVLEIADLQLERGPIATPFEYRLYPEELALCQRYYWTDHLYGQGYQQANLDYSEIIQHPVEMRANPTRTLIGSLNYSSNLSALILASSPGTNGKNFTRAYGRATGNGYIEFGQAFSLDAEL